MFLLVLSLKLNFYACVNTKKVRLECYSFACLLRCIAVVKAFLMLSN